MERLDTDWKGRNDKAEEKDKIETRSSWGGGSGNVERKTRGSRVPSRSARVEWWTLPLQCRTVMQPWVRPHLDDVNTVHYLQCSHTYFLNRMLDALLH